MRDKELITIHGFSNDMTRVFHAYVFINTRAGSRWKNKALAKILLEIQRHNKKPRVETAVSSVATMFGRNGKIVTVATVNIDLDPEQKQHR